MRDGISLYVVRHGQTDWNAERRYQGQADVPLNELGRQQALRNGQALASVLRTPQDIDFIASPLGRARETMEIVLGELGLKGHCYQVAEALKELSYGHWEGTLQADLPDVDPEGLAARAADPLNWRPRNGESYADLLKRSRDWLAGVDKDTLIAGHGGTMRTLHALTLGLAAELVPTLAAPQDRVLILERGTVSWL